MESLLNTPLLNQLKDGKLPSMEVVVTIPPKTLGQLFGGMAITIIIILLIHQLIKR
jgi:hypothetical protein